jgi:hypothetical protein
MYSITKYISQAKPQIQYLELDNAVVCEYDGNGIPVIEIFLC